MADKDRFVYPSSSISYGRTKFKMPHKHKTSFYHGQLIPLDAFEVLPGDTFKLNVASLIRMSTPIAPIMDDIEMHIAAYFVPNRLVFENWEELMGANKTGAWYNLGNFNILAPHYDETTMGASTASDILEISISSSVIHRFINSTSSTRINGRTNITKI